MTRTFQHIIRFFLLIAVQVLFLNNLQISGYINPYIYILFIMFLPPKLPKVAVLSTAFIMGFVIDIFSDSYGLHTAATVLLGYARPLILSLVSVKGGEDLDAISIKQLKLGRFFTYTGFLCFIHHFTLFYLEAFRLNEFIDTFGRAFISTMVTLLLIFITEIIRSNHKKR